MTGLLFTFAVMVLISVLTVEFYESRAVDDEKTERFTWKEKKRYR